MKSTKSSCATKCRLLLASASEGCAGVMARSCWFSFYCAVDGDANYATLTNSNCFRVMQVRACVFLSTSRTSWRKCAHFYVQNQLCSFATCFRFLEMSDFFTNNKLCNKSIRGKKWNKLFEISLSMISSKQCYLINILFSLVIVDLLYRTRQHN